MLRQWRRTRGLLLGDAARAIGVSADTLRRWERAGKLRTRRDGANRRRVPQSEIERVAGHPERHRAGDALSARNRFQGVVTSVQADGVMALVEIEAGPAQDHRRDHPRRGRGARAGARRAGHGGGEGHLRDGGARVRRGGDLGGRRCSPSRGCGGDDDGAAPGGVGGFVDDGGAHGLRPRLRRRHRPALLRGLRRAGRADPAGREARRVRRGEHRDTGGAARRRPALGAGRVRHERARDRCAARLRASRGSRT